MDCLLCVEVDLLFSRFVGLAYQPRGTFIPIFFFACFPPCFSFARPPVYTTPSFFPQAWSEGSLEICVRSQMFAGRDFKIRIPGFSC